MRKTRIIIILLAIITVAVAVLYLYPQAGKSRGDEVEVKTVVVANQDIPLNTTVTGEMLTTKDYPLAYVPVGAFENAEEIVGLIANIDIRAGNVIRTSDVLGAGETARKLSLIVPEGKRAMSLQVDPISGVSNMIKIGDRVDVIAVLSVDSKDKVKMLAQNVEILALDQRMAENEAAEGAVSYETVTLSLAPTDTVPIALAICDGTVYLSLRREGDAALVPVKATDAGEVMR